MSYHQSDDTPVTLRTRKFIISHHLLRWQWFIHRTHSSRGTSRDMAISFWNTRFGFTSLSAHALISIYISLIYISDTSTTNASPRLAWCSYYNVNRRLPCLRSYIKGAEGVSSYPTTPITTTSAVSTPPNLLFPLCRRLNPTSPACRSKTAISRPFLWS